MVASTDPTLANMRESSTGRSWMNSQNRGQVKKQNLENRQHPRVTKPDISKSQGHLLKTLMPLATHCHVTGCHRTLILRTHRKHGVSGFRPRQWGTRACTRHQPEEHVKGRPVVRGTCECRASRREQRLSASLFGPTGRNAF